VSERKDVLSAFFWVLTMAFYLRYTRQRCLARYLPVAGSFTLGILAKPMLVTLPFVLLLLDYWPLKRISTPPFNLGDAGRAGPADETAPSGTIRNAHASPPAAPATWAVSKEGIGIIVAEKLPLMALTLLSCVITYYAQLKGGAVASQEALSMAHRIPNVLSAYAAYLGKTLWPLRLAFFYPFETASILSPGVALSAVVLLAVTAAVLGGLKRFPYLAVGWFWYLGTLVPVIGIVQVGLQSMADRYTYIPLIGISIMAVWGLSETARRWAHGTKALGTAAALSCAAAVFLSWNQASTWKDSETLLRHALAVTTDNVTAHNNLGLILLEKGDLDGAIAQYQEIIRINPGYAKAYINIARAYENLKDMKTAERFYREGIRHSPLNAELHAAYGGFLDDSKRPAEAIGQFQKALELDPASVEILVGFGNAMLKAGSYDEAIRQYLKALELDPVQAAVHNNLGTAYIHTGNLKKATEAYQRALALEPGYEDAARNLDNARSNQARYRELIAGIHKSMAAGKPTPELLTRLGGAYHQLGEHESAMENYRKALALQGTYVPALYGISLLYSSEKDYAQALTYLERILPVQPDRPEAYYNIACIHARQNRVDDALKWLKKAVDKGFRDWDLLKKDPDLASIRDTAYYLSLVNPR